MGQGCNAHLELMQHAALAELLLGQGAVRLEDDVQQQRQVGHARPLPRRQLTARLQRRPRRLFCYLPILPVPATRLIAIFEKEQTDMQTEQMKTTSVFLDQPILRTGQDKVKL